MRRGMRFQHNWGIRRRVLFLAVVPMVLVSIMIGFYLTKAHIDYMRRTMDEHGHEIARNLGFAAEFSLLIDDRERLQQIVDRAFFGPEIDAVMILDRRGDVVARRVRQGFDSQLKQGGKPRAVKVYAFDVVSTASGTGESEELRAAGESRRFGRVLVYLSRDHLANAARDVIVRSTLFILFGLLFASLLALLLARELLAPIQRIINLVGRVQRGDLSSRLARRSGAELGELEQGINSMVRTIENSQQDLEARVTEATAALQKTVAELREKGAALEASRREAVEAGQARERFLALVSHELRTQLNAIVGFAELLEKAPDARQSHEYVQIIHSASQQLLAIIDDVLSYSGLNAGTLQVEKKPFNPEPLLEDVVSLLSRDAHRKGLELVLMIHRDTPRCVVGDPVRFSQVVTNLLINAIKFTDSGEIIVVSESVDDGRGGRQLLVSVDDSGIGIRDGIRDSLFEPFVQGDSSIQKRFGGTGLGLSISRSLMEKMGGRIWLDDSTLGGSRFCVVLPAAEDEAIDVDDGLRNALAGLKALVVDSHAVSRRAIKNTLLHFGMQVFLQPRGLALEAVIRDAAGGGEPFDVLVVGGKADEFPRSRMRQLQRLVTDTGVRIVVLISDEDQIRDKCEMVEAGVCLSVSTKPIRRHRLLENLRQVLDCGAATPPQPAPEAPAETAASAMPGITALIADDNAFSRQLLQISLARHGVAVEASEDGFELLEKSRQRQYDIIFLDINMPAMDGLSVARVIREETVNNRTPLVAVTADLFTSEAKSTRETLFDATLFKPVKPDEVGAVVDSLLQRRAAPAPGKADTPEDDSLWTPARFSAALDEQLELLRQAARDGDRERLRQVAHQINGLTGYFGHESLSRQGRLLEERALTASDDELEALIAALREAAASVAS